MARSIIPDALGGLGRPRGLDLLCRRVVGCGGMRYVVATIGALFIFVAVFILSVFVVAFLPPVFRTPVQIGILETNNPLGALLASLAATSSFWATLRRYSKTRQPGRKTPTVQQHYDFDEIVP